MNVICEEPRKKSFTGLRDSTLAAEEFTLPGKKLFAGLKEVLLNSTSGVRVSSLYLCDRYIA